EPLNILPCASVVSPVSSVNLRIVSCPLGLTISRDALLRSLDDSALLKSLISSILLVLFAPSLISLMKSLSASGLSGAIVSVSVAVLLAVLVSLTPDGGLTVTVLVIEPVAAGSIVPASVIVALAPEARVTVHTSLVVLKVPELGVPNTGLSNAFGIVSLRVTLLTVLGPLLVTVIVQVSVVPGTTDVSPSLLAIARSACGDNVSVSVAVLLPALVSLPSAGLFRFTVLVIEPVAAGSIVPASVIVALAPEARVTVHTS